MKHPVTARVCATVMEVLDARMRNIAGYINRGVATWHSYVHGHTRPPDDVLLKLAHMVQLNSVPELIRWAFQQKKPRSLRPGRRRRG